jgi:hypothetical protein
MEAIRIQLLSLKSTREVVQQILQMKQDERNIVISFLWVWWDTRNKLNAGEQARPMAEVLHRTMELSCSTKNQSMMQNDGSKNNGLVTKRWQPPPANVLKVNTDGAFLANEKEGSWGFIIRDGDGHGVLAGSGKLYAIYDALAPEGEASLLPYMLP